MLLIGVDDDGTVLGVQDPRIDERVVNVAADLVGPPLALSVELVSEQRSGRRVAVVTVERGYAVHALWHHNHFAW